MNASEIHNKLKKYCKHEFIGVFPRDRLPRRLPPRRPLLLVCNTDKHDKPGKHWIAIYIGRDMRGEYFDSSGMPPLKDFEMFMNRFSNVWIYNDKQLQSIISYVCGHYCIMYCILKTCNYSLVEFVNCFTTDTGFNDYIAHNYVCNK